MVQWYGVEYRNMSTAIHGLFVYDNLDDACAVDDYLAENAETYSEVAGDRWTMEHAMKEASMVDVDYSEIDYRHVNWDDDLHEYVYCDPYNETPIIVVNTGHVVHDLW